MEACSFISLLSQQPVARLHQVDVAGPFFFVNSLVARAHTCREVGCQRWHDRGRGMAGPLYLIKK